MNKTTIHDLLQELQSFQSIDSKTLALAKKSTITYQNSKEFRDLLLAWTQGVYDEDVPMLVNELENLL